MVPSIISTDLKITGNLVSSGEIQIDGTILGDIRSKVLLVGEKAQITGEIIADTVRVHGSVNGQIKAKTVNLAKNAHVVGNILHENLSIEKGAFLEGHITRMEVGTDLLSEQSKPNEQQKPASGTAGLAKAMDGAKTPPDGARHGAPDERVNLVINKSQPARPVPTSAQGNAVTGAPHTKTPSAVAHNSETKKTVLS